MYHNIRWFSDIFTVTSTFAIHADIQTHGLRNWQCNSVVSVYMGRKRFDDKFGLFMKLSKFCGKITANKPSMSAKGSAKICPPTLGVGTILHSWTRTIATTRVSNNDHIFQLP